MYAQVNKKNKDANEIQDNESQEEKPPSENYETVLEHHENIETKSTGFEIDHPSSSSRVQVRSDVYEEVEFGDKANNVDEGDDNERPYVTTFAYSKNNSSTESGSRTSTPRIVEDVPTKDVQTDEIAEPIWDHIPVSEEVDLENVTTRF